MEELGLEAGPELHALQRQILQHDPALGAPRCLRAPSGSPGRRALAATVAGLFAVGALVVALFLLDARPTNRRPALAAALIANRARPVATVAGQGGLVVAIDPATDRILTEVQVGSAPGDIAVGGGSVWVLNANDQTISQINPHIRQVVNTFAAGSSPVRLAYGDGSLWVGSNAGLPLLNPDLASVARVNPSTSALPADVIKLPVAVLNAAFQFGNDAPWASKLVATSRAVWVASSDGSVYRIGPSSGRIVATIRDLPSGLLAPGRTGVWAVGADEHRGYLSLISARTNHVIARITVPATNITRPVNGDGALWFSGNYSPGADGLTWGSGGQQLLWRVRRGAIKRNFLNLGPGATSIAYGTGSVWVTNVVANTVIRVNPATLHVVHVIALPGSPSDVAVAGGLVWASVTLVGSPSRRPTPTPGNSCDGYGEVGLPRCP